MRSGRRKRWRSAFRHVLAGNVDPLRTIDNLSESNGNDPDVGRERRLVELRHSAVEHLRQHPARAEWPPTIEDPFPGVLLPEIDAAELSAGTVGGAVLHHGAVVVRDLIDTSGVARLVECINSALDGAAEWRARQESGDTRAHTDNPWFDPFDRQPGFLGMGTEWVRMVDSPRATFEYTRLLGPLGRGPIAEYLGERPVMDSYKWTLRRTTPDCGGGWHQDGRFLGDGVRVLNVWIALTRCGGGTAAAGLEVVPRRLDLLPSGTEGADFEWSIARDVVERVADGTICDPVFEPGDALIFDERTAHRTGHRPGLTSHRHAIEAWFFAPSNHVKDEQSFVF